MNIETLQAYVSIVKDIITGLAALTATVIGIIGLQTWKKQLRGKTEYELAQRLLRATYKVRDAMEEFRHTNSAKSATYRALKEHFPDQRINDHDLYADVVKTVYFQRWRPVQDATDDLDTLTLEAEAIWGEWAVNHLRRLRCCIGTLGSHMSSFLATIRIDNLHTSIDYTDKVLYRPTPLEPDEFSSELSIAVRQIENFLKPYLKI